jgi:hypothetical protein
MVRQAFLDLSKNMEHRERETVSVAHEARCDAMPPM